MKLELRIIGQNGAEIIRNAEAIVLLLHNKKGMYSFMVGPKNLIHKLFIECSLRWPSVIDWGKEAKQRIHDVLEPNVSADDSTFYHIDNDLITNEYKTLGSGKVSFFIRDVKAENESSLSINITGIDDALISIWIDGQALVASNGWSSEKRELMFYGAEILFGHRVSYQLREAVLGKREIDLGDGRIIEIDLTDLARKSLNTWRSHRTEPGEIVLSAEMWGKLAEKRLRNGKITPSVN